MTVIPDVCRHPGCFAVTPDLLRKRNTLRLNHAKMQAFWRGTRLVCFSGAGSPSKTVILNALREGSSKLSELHYT